jgi:hypothetical protein
MGHREIRFEDPAQSNPQLNHKENETSSINPESKSETETEEDL